MIDKELWLKIHWKNGLGDYLSVLEDLDQRLKHDLNNESKWFTRRFSIIFVIAL